jgi:hypothetical protein
MELMESSFDLMQNPCSQFQRDFLDDAYSFRPDWCRSH